MITKNREYKLYPYAVFTLMIVSILFLNCKFNETMNSQNNNEPSNMNSETSTTELDINKTVKGAYKVWYVKKGEEPNFSKYKDYYSETAVFQDLIEGDLSIFPLSDQVNEFKQGFKAGHLISFDEREIGAKTTYFGNVAHRISHHIYYINSDDTITKRGTNSIQLVKSNGTWKIQSILRQIESDIYHLPEKFNSK